MAASISSVRYILADDDSWTDWYTQIIQQAISFEIETFLDPIDPKSSPLEYPGMPKDPEIIRESDYLTEVVSIPSTPDIVAQNLQPVYELTYVNKVRFSDDRVRYARDLDVAKEKRAHYSRLRNFIFETIDESNKAHLHNCITSCPKAPIGKLVEILKIHRQQDEPAQRSALNTRLQQLKSLPFPENYDEQIIRLKEWFNLCVRGQAVNHPTYIGYTVIEDLLFSIQGYNEAIFQTHFEKVLQCERAKKPADFQGLIAELKQKLSSYHAIKALRTETTQFHSTFATLQGTRNEANDDRSKQNNFESTENGGGSKRKKGPKSNSRGPNKKQRQNRVAGCPCGRGCTGNWSKCYYLTPSAAPPSQGSIMH
ncbi:hypothetical protein GcM3_040026 [Golovinomyces cichoracearum]|uniref:Uncharacterized protein n=1 Tax=Golovinomyces cichoracearum TaxID=62708 RepID=A0A420J2N2_9PEZI|nr:hypothetical protein GcM3_040026 [Golovinomyces cichoracearum]